MSGTLKVDCTKDPTGFENNSIVLRYVDKINCVKERLVSMTTAQHFDAMSLTKLILSQLKDKELSTDKILSQCYDGASVMSGTHGGVQKLLQDELQREVPYVHCLTINSTWLSCMPCLLKEHWQTSSMYAALFISTSENLQWPECTMDKS